MPSSRTRLQRKGGDFRMAKKKKAAKKKKK